MDKDSSVFHFSRPNLAFAQIPQATIRFLLFPTILEMGIRDLTPISILLKNDDCGSVVCEVVIGNHLRVFLQDGVDHLALHPDAAPMNDADLAESFPQRLKEVFLNHTGDFLGLEAVQVDSVFDWQLRVVCHLRSYLHFARNALDFGSLPCPFLHGRDGMQTRLEKDSLGERPIPAEAYYGIQTDRAIANFPISGLRPKPSYLDATVHIKKAAARTNQALGLLDSKKAEAIVKACDEILSGKLREWFVVDVYQAGAGTSHNMNANEVIANRAIELMGGSKGDYSIIHPNDHVNMAQSTNDVCPTAIRIGALILTQPLFHSLIELEGAFRNKEKEFDAIVKSGRTHLQDAVPIRMGQEFGAYAVCMHKHREAIGRAADSCKELGIGGTAVGTGLNAHPQYRPMMVKELSHQLGIAFRMADDYFEAMQSLRPLVELSGAIRNLSQDLIRIANDLRLLSSGPKTGLAEITLPELQPGSSIMPGKVNPVMPEMLDMVCFQVIGCDTTILMAAQAGQMELNVMMPVVAFNLMHEIEILANAISAFRNFCIAGIQADAARCQAYAEASMSIVTVLNPHIGYAAAAQIAKEYLASGKSIAQIILDKKLLTKEKLDEVFQLRNMTEPGIK